MNIQNPRTEQFPHLQSYRTTDAIEIEGPRMYQVHGDRVVNITDPGQEIGEADGMVTGLSDVVLWTRTADCGNLYFYDPVIGVIGICHAGWRGTALNIIAQVIQSMQSLGSLTKDIYVYSGPAICAHCHHFIQQTGGLFEEKYYEGGYLNLRSVWRDQLVSVGILLDHIVISEQCTSCDHALPSYKRDGTGGRIVGVISLDR